MKSKAERWADELDQFGFALDSDKDVAAELRRLAAVEAELERIKALPPVAWMYDRAGSAFNPQFLPAGSKADQRRNGIVSEGVVILNPDSACKNWQPLTALGSKTHE